ncbi:hypothetical protein Anapl_09281 [Anas platyrhynchos]|uniref:Uncharacterized protein n=1 Tax=Anas platyrhynchos TaxID=8839 RepID=R0LFX0_ANAPL|nr:hypothetical protein Anapl_09281 [Anas platyrhynchos]
MSPLIPDSAILLQIYSHPYNTTSARLVQLLAGQCGKPDQGTDAARPSRILTACRRPGVPKRRSAAPWRGAEDSSLPARPARAGLLHVPGAVLLLVRLAPCPGVHFSHRPPLLPTPWLAFLTGSLPSSVPSLSPRQRNACKAEEHKHYQLLPSTQTQQKAIKGIVNASLFALSSYSSVSATSIQRELQVAFPSQLSNTHQETKGKRLYQAPSALQDVEIHPHADLSQAPARAACKACSRGVQMSQAVTDLNTYCDVKDTRPINGLQMKRIRSKDIYKHPTALPSAYEVQFGALFVTINKPDIAETSCIQKQQVVNDHLELVAFSLFAEVKELFD